ncbi:hypothetical protein LCGC14_3067910, partial [marine sediment metagenome]
AITILLIGYCTIFVKNFTTYKYVQNLTVASVTTIGKKLQVILIENN